MTAIAATLTSCSNDIDTDDTNNTHGKGMTLAASIDQQQDTRAAIDASETFGSWTFAFTANDKVMVGNSTIGNYYTFTKNDDSSDLFSCPDAKTTATAADWYAYYPSTTIDLTNQAGTETSAASLYALAGATATATTGTDGLTINMKKQAAILRIVKVDNYGPCDIYLKTADGKYVSGLKAKTHEAGYDVVTSDSKVSVFTKESAGNAGIYYVIVPAGVKISIYNTNDENRISTTKDAGLTAGKYYTVTSGPTTGTETATLANGTTKTINWVQLWIAGPRFATENVGALTWDEAVKTGSNFAWGDKWRTPSVDDIKPFVDIAADQNNWAGKTEVNVAGYPTFNLIDITQGGEYNSAVQITGYQPGYNKNSLYLYNNIIDGYGTYNFWTSAEASDNHDYGGEFEIIEYYSIIGGFGMSYRTKKEEKILTRPILTTNTILWADRYVK